MRESENAAHFCVVVSNGFGMLSYASVVDVLKQMRDYHSGRAITWQTLSSAKGPVRAANGLQVLPDGTIGAGMHFDFVVVIGTVDSAVAVDHALEAWIRDQYTHGATICSTASGTWMLARAGLLSGKSCTLHWRDIDVFKEVYPDIEILDEVYVQDGRIVTCSGARTASDMIYSVLGQQFGQVAVDRVRQVLFHERLIQPHESQKPLQERLKALSPEAYRLLLEIEDGINLHEPIESICRRLRLKRRTVENAFRKHTGVTPKQYQLELRLLRAASLLKMSRLTISEISEAIGFSSPGAFSTAFLKKMHCSPRSYRRQSNQSVPAKIWSTRS